MTKLGITWDEHFHRLRCNGHIINLTAQAFLFPDKERDDPANYTADDNDKDSDEDEKELEAQIRGQIPDVWDRKQMEEWRRKGELGKIHNIVVYIAGSTQRLEAFKTLAEANGLGLLRDNSTRWNSWFKMLERALKLIDAIKIYCFKNADDLAEDTLSAKEWENVNKLIEFLTYFRDATAACEGRFATIDTILPTMDFLLERLEAGRRNPTYITDKFLYPCIDAGWRKLRKYYLLTERSPAYTAAIVLCPNTKWTYFRSAEWKSDWVRIAKKDVAAYWKREYKGLEQPELPPETDENPAILKQRPNTFFEWKAKKRALTTPSNLDEYDEYINAPVIYVKEPFDPRAWWLEPTQRTTYPNLSKMALDLLSIPATSAEVERLFSSCNITITDRRNQIGIRTVEAEECLKSWMRRDNIAFVDNVVAATIGLQCVVKRDE